MTDDVDRQNVDRLVEVETRLAFQEQALVELSDALAALREDSARVGELLQRVLQQQSSVSDEFFAQAVDEPPPPHY